MERTEAGVKSRIERSGSHHRMRGAVQQSVKEET